MAEQVQGRLSHAKAKVAIVVSRFNHLVSQHLLEGALDCLHRHDISGENIRIFWVPGSLELPLIAQTAAQSGKYDSVICLGTIIRGATAHFEYLASTTTRGVSEVALKTGIPVIFGVLTTNTIEQAFERAGTKAGNKGWDAAQSALEMVDLLRQM